MAKSREELMNPPPKGVARGPKAEWGHWRDKRTNRIANPRRNKAALKLGAPKKPEGA